MNLNTKNTQEKLKNMQIDGANPENCVCDAEFNKIFADTNFRAIKGCFYKIEQYSEATVPKLLCNFIPWITSQEILDDGNEIITKFKIAGKHSDDYNLPEITVTSAEFCNMDWALKNWGISCIISSGQAKKDTLREGIQWISKYAKREYVFTYTGWKKCQNKWIYLHNGGAVGAESIIVRLKEKLQNYQFPNELSKNLIEDAKKVFQLEKVTHKHIVLPLLAFTFLSPLNEFLRQAKVEPNFVYYICGRTGAGKTILTALFLSFFGHFHKETFPASFKATSSAIIDTSFTLKDTLMGIDDFKPFGVDRHEHGKTLRVIESSFGERSGRVRCNVNGKCIKSPYPRGNAIITAETMSGDNENQESGIARRLIIEMKVGDIDLDSPGIKKEIDIAQENAEDRVYSSFMASYIIWLKEKWLDVDCQKFVNSLAQRFKKTRKKMAEFLYSKKLNCHSRFSGILAHITIGYEFYLDFCEFCGAINFQEKQLKMQEFTDCLKILARTHVKNIEAEKPSKKFISVVNSLISTNSISVYELSETNHREPMPGTFCFEDENYYWFEFNKLYNVVLEFLRKQNETFPLNSNTLIKHLFEDGYILPKQQNNWTHVKKIKGKLLRLLPIKKEKIIVG
jgi:hypothetical protein